MSLSAYIELTAGDPFEWGVSDCGLWAAGAAAFITGVDPASHVRGTYSTRVGYHRTVIEAGGLVAFASKIMDGFAPLERDGVGVLRLGDQTLCGLIVEGRAIMKMQSGLRIADDYQILKGWTCRRL